LSEKDRRTEILNDRIYFLVEVFIVFVGITIINIVFNSVLNLFQIESLLNSYLYFLFKLLAALIAVPVFLFVVNFLFRPSKQNLIMESYISSSKQQLFLLKIKKRNFKYQLLWGLLLLFIVYVPIDLFSLLLPGYIQYESEVFYYSNPTGLGAYFGEEFYIFLISAIIIHFLSSFKEEWIYRGFLVNRGEKFFNKFSAIFISSFFFGLLHIASIFTPINAGEASFYPFIWGSVATLVGFISASFLTRKKWLFPLIFAHTVSNIISATTLWYSIHGSSISDIFLFLYIPLIIIGIIISFFQFSRVKKGVNLILKDVKAYFKVDQKLKESGSDRIVRIIFDIIIILIIWLMSFIFLI